MSVWYRFFFWWCVRLYNHGHMFSHIFFQAIPAPFASKAPTVSSQEKNQTLGYADGGAHGYLSNKEQVRTREMCLFFWVCFCLFFLDCVFWIVFFLVCLLFLFFWGYLCFLCVLCKK